MIREVLNIVEPCRLAYLKGNHPQTNVLGDPYFEKHSISWLLKQFPRCCAEHALDMQNESQLMAAFAIPFFEFASKENERQTTRIGGVHLETKLHEATCQNPGHGLRGFKGQFEAPYVSMSICRAEQRNLGKPQLAAHFDSEQATICKKIDHTHTHEQT